jgi:hypothetical protein
MFSFVPFWMFEVKSKSKTDFIVFKFSLLKLATFLQSLYVFTEQISYRLNCHSQCEYHIKKLCFVMDFVFT